MNQVLSLAGTAFLLVVGVLLYGWANHIEPSQRPLIASIFLFYAGILVLASYYWWDRIVLLRIIKFIFSDLSFPRGVKWLPWWGGFIILLALGKATVWIFSN